MPKSQTEKITLRMLPFVILLQRQNFRGGKKKPGAKSEMREVEALPAKRAGGIWGTTGLLCAFTGAVLVSLCALVTTQRSH